MCIFENCVLLGYYAASSGNFLPTFRDKLLVPSSDFSTLRMGPISCPEMSVKITTTRWVITQKSTVLSYFAAEA